MTTERLFAGRGHRYLAALRYRRTLKTFIHGHTEDERVAGGQAGAHQLEVVGQALVIDSPVLWRIRVTIGRRLHGEFRNVVGPFGFGTGSLRTDSFDAIADLRPAI